MGTKKNLDKIFEYTNHIQNSITQAYEKFFGSQHFLPGLKEIYNLGLSGDYLHEFQRTINQIENKLINTFKKESKKILFNDDGSVMYSFNNKELDKLNKEVIVLTDLFKGLEYTKTEEIDKALVCYCEAIKKDNNSIFHYLCLANTLGYLSELNKKLNNIGLSINADDLNISITLIKNLFYQKKLVYDGTEKKVDTSFFEDSYNNVLKCLMNLIIKRDDFEEHLLKIGISTNEVFTLNEDLVDRLYIIKRTRKDNPSKRGNLGLEAKILKYFRGVNNIFEKDSKKMLNLPRPIKFMDNVDKNYNYLIIDRKKGETLLSLLYQERCNNQIMEDFVLQTARIHALGPIPTINKDKYFVKKEKYREQLESYLQKCSLSAEQIAEFKKLLDPVIRMITNCRDLGFVKDANLENAICTKEGKIISIDFEEIKYAPLQYDLSRMLTFSFDKKDELLDKYIQEYNKTLRDLRLNGLKKNILNTFNELACKEKRLVYDNNDFKFVFLNYTIFYSVLVYFSPKYDNDSRMKKKCLDNAVESIDEVLTKYDCDWYKGSYPKENWYEKIYTQEEKEKMVKLRGLLENLKNGLSY